jgi:hypothetical protein
MTVLLGNIHVHMLTWSGWAFSILISWLDLLYLLEFGIYGFQLPSLLVCWSCKCVRNVEHSFWLVQQFVHRQVVELLLLLELLQAETCKLTVYQICFFDFWTNAALWLWFWSNAFLRIDVWVFLLEYIFDLLQKWSEHWLITLTLSCKSGNIFLTNSSELWLKSTLDCESLAFS